PRRPERLPDRAGKGRPWRGAPRHRARVHARGRTARGGQPVGRGRPRLGRLHEGVLPGDAGVGTTAGGRAPTGAARPAVARAVARPLLLGRVRARGRMELKRSGPETAPLPGRRRGGWIMSRAALRGLLSSLGPDEASAGREYERLRDRLIVFFAV